MPKPAHVTASLQSDKPIILVALAISLYVLIIIYHGFIAFGRDTIETVPYALWMADENLFPTDFHLSHLRDIFPNERWLISWILHFFPDHIKIASWILHAICSLTLIAGMLKIGDFILKNIELAMLAVFICLFSLYNINIGSNELYYNMFVPSLAGKALAVWGVYYLVKERFFYASAFLALSTFLHPLVGFQLFVIAVPMLLWLVFFRGREVQKREILYFVMPYVLTAGIWIFLLLGAQGPKGHGEIAFFDIVRFRIAHHFFPAFFPLKSMLFLGILYIISLYYFVKKKSIIAVFIIVSLLGMVVYCIGLSLELDLVLSSQWMKVNIWLKFFAIIACLGVAQDWFEKRYMRLVTLGIFLCALVIAMLRFDPSWDKPPPSDLYAWITINTSQDDLFLVPPELVDFKAYTRRGSYFDFKAMLHHQPAIFEWAKRFEDVHGIKIGDRSPSEDIFAKMRNSYFAADVLTKIPQVDFLIARQDQLTEEQIITLEESWKLVFLGESYSIYEQEERN